MGLHVFGSQLLIDTTASDIQPLGSRSAGSKGQAADAGHVHAMPTLDQVGAPAGSVALGGNRLTGLANGVASTDAATVAQVAAAAARIVARNQALGFKDQAWDLFSASISGATFATQDVWYVLCGFNAGDVVTNLITLVTTAGGGTAPTGIYLGLFSSAGAQEAITANLNSSAIWTSTGFAVAALASPFTIPATGGYYLAFLQNGAFASTPLQLGSRALNAAEVKTISGGVPFAGVQTGQATPPSPATITANAGANLWLGWS